MRRRIIAVLLSIAIIGGVVYINQSKVKEEAPVEIKEIYIPRYLGKEDLSLLYTCKPQPKHETTINLTQDEAMLLMITARCEGGASLEGQLWTMRTIINRVEDDVGDFKDVNTVGEVIFQDGQFEVIHSKYFTQDILNENSHIALGLCESGWNKTRGSLYWESSTNSDSSWHKKNLTFVEEVEGNLFYK